MHFVLPLVSLGVSLAAASADHLNGRSLAGSRYGGYGHTDTFVCANTTCDANPLSNSCYCGPLQHLTPTPLKNYHEPKRSYGGYGKTVGGVCEEQFAGYWCDNLDFFKNQKEKSGYGHSKKCSKTVTSINNSTLNKTANGDTSWLYSGVLKIKKYGTYSFELTCSDACALLVGGKVVVNSPQIKIVDDRINKTTCDHSVKLKKGYYKVQIAYGISNITLGGEQKEIIFKWGKKGSTLTTDLTHFFPEKKHKRKGRSGRHFGNEDNSYGDSHSSKSYNEHSKSSSGSHSSKSSKGYGDHGNDYGDSHSSKSYNEHKSYGGESHGSDSYSSDSYGGDHSKGYNEHGKGGSGSHSSKSDNEYRGYNEYRSYNEHSKNSYGGDHNRNNYGRNSYNEHSKNSYSGHRNFGGSDSSGSDSYGGDHSRGYGGDRKGYGGESHGSDSYSSDHSRGYGGYSGDSRGYGGDSHGSERYGSDSYGGDHSKGYGGESHGSDSYYSSKGYGGDHSDSHGSDSYSSDRKGYGGDSHGSEYSVHSVSYSYNDHSKGYGSDTHGYESYMRDNKY